MCVCVCMSHKKLRESFFLVVLLIFFRQLTFLMFGSLLYKEFPIFFAQIFPLSLIIFKILKEKSYGAVANVLIIRHSNEWVRRTVTL